MLRILGAILAAFCVAALFYLLWQPYLRISNVAVSNGDTSIEAIVREPLAGTVWGILPRDSYFLVPDETIRNSILAAHPELEAVSISHSSLTSLAVTVTGRVPLARWCGMAYEPDLPRCYFFDTTGFIYGEAASSTMRAGSQLLSTLLVYAPLADEAPGIEAVGRTLRNAGKLPAAFQFARDMAKLGAIAESLAIRGDEADLHLEGGTRVTYVLGDEERAYALVSSAASELDFPGASLEYVDLRFTDSGKVYLKRKE